MSFSRFLLPIFALLTAPLVAGDHGDHFGIHVVDSETGRGVPMIQLKLTNHTSSYTDSAGWVAFHEPGLMDTTVYFEVHGEGYEHRADGFGFRGVRLETVPGGRATITVNRLLPAERLYRLTGAGIYRDSVLLGEETPLREPLLNGRVMGQDSALAVLYRGRIHWFWGDTSRPEYPLGNFAASGATALLPDAGGLAPSVGVDYTYLVNEQGFSRGVVEMEGEGVKWLGGIFTLQDNQGETRMVGRVSRMRSLGEEFERAMVVWDDADEVFRPLASLPMGNHPAPGGHAFHHEVDGVPYIYFATPFPHIRVPANWQAIQDPQSYEAFTPLRSGGHESDSTDIERDAEGRAVWGWKPATPTVNIIRERELVKDGQLAETERRLLVKDAATGNEVTMWGASVRWNGHLGRWLMIGHEFGGSPSFLGEVWATAADSPEGPWSDAVKIATHRVHDFYNVVHHDFLDEEDGRVVYFEGTLSGIFAPTAPEIPRYQYNQIMYRLDLDDPRISNMLSQ